MAKYIYDASISVKFFGLQEKGREEIISRKSCSCDTYNNGFVGGGFLIYHLKKSNVMYTIFYKNILNEKLLLILFRLHHWFLFFLLIITYHLKFVVKVKIYRENIEWKKK